MTAFSITIYVVANDGDAFTFCPNYENDLQPHNSHTFCIYTHY